MRCGARGLQRRLVFISKSSTRVNTSLSTWVFSHIFLRPLTPPLSSRKKTTIFVFNALNDAACLWNSPSCRKQCGHQLARENAMTMCWSGFSARNLAKSKLPAIVVPLNAGASMPTVIGFGFSTGGASPSAANAWHIMPRHRLRRSNVFMVGTLNWTLSQLYVFCYFYDTVYTVFAGAI